MTQTRQKKWQSTMAKLGKFKRESDTGELSCRHKLGSADVTSYIDDSEGATESDALISVAEELAGSWKSHHDRLTKLVAEELRQQEYLADDDPFASADCVPFYVRVYADPDGEISYTVAFNVPGILDDDEYAEVEQEAGGAWVNVGVNSTE